MDWSNKSDQLHMLGKVLDANAGAGLKIVRYTTENDSDVFHGMTPAGKRRLTMAKYIVDW
jgi:hypothetical protein